MRVLIEGTDLTGKSTLAKSLSCSLVHPYKHMDKPEYAYAIHNYLSHFRDHGVYDRAHLGSIVYGEALGYHEHVLKPNHVRILERFLMWSEAILIIVTADPLLLVDRFNSADREEMCNVENILLANELFTALVYQTEFAKEGKLIHVHCTSEKPYPDPVFLSSVLPAILAGEQLQKENSESGVMEYEAPEVHTTDGESTPDDILF